jgi:hypothetical protein
MKKVLILFLLVSVTVFSQNLNEYKYALIPAKFSFLKDSNMYNLNALTKMYMEKYGFETYLDNETYSNDFASTNCNKVFIDVVSNSNMFTTKVSVVIKDCKNNVLFISEEGKSNDKEFKVAYNLALRQAFDNFSVLKGHKFIQEKETIIRHEQDNEGLLYTLFPKIIKNGYELYQSKSKLIFTVLKTKTENVFIAYKNDIQGIIYLKNKEWFFDYYKEEVLISEQIDIDFDNLDDRKYRGE